MFSILQFLLLTGCSSDSAPSAADTVVERTEENTPNSDPGFDDPWSYQPDMVLFHNVVIVRDGDQIACYDDGDGTPYCGVHKTILTVWEDWGGLSDDNNCQIIHRISPDYLTELSSESSDDFASMGVIQAWEFDAAQSFVGTTPMCDLIAEDSDIMGAVNMFKNENPTFGYKSLSEEMESEYKENFGSDYTDEEWDAQVSPYLTGLSHRISGRYRTTNVGVVYQIEEDNTVAADSEGYYTTVLFDNPETLPDGYYRATPFYAYDIDKFIPETTETND